MHPRPPCPAAACAWPWRARGTAGLSSCTASEQSAEEPSEFPQRAGNASSGPWRTKLDDAQEHWSGEAATLVGHARGWQSGVAAAAASGRGAQGHWRPALLGTHRRTRTSRERALRSPAPLACAAPCGLFIYRTGSYHRFRWFGLPLGRLPRTPPTVPHSRSLFPFPIICFVRFRALRSFSLLQRAVRLLSGVF